MEYVIEAADVDDMKSWLATIKYCMRSPPTTQPPPDALPGMPEPAPPDLPPRRDLPSSSSNVDLATDTPEEAELGEFSFLGNFVYGCAECWFCTPESMCWVSLTY